MPNLLSAPPQLKIPGAQYSQADMRILVNQINQIVQILLAQGAIIGTELRLTDCPNTGYGLRPGSVYADGDSHLVIVRGDEAFAPIFNLTVTINSPTVTTS